MGQDLCRFCVEIEAGQECTEIWLSNIRTVIAFKTQQLVGAGNYCYCAPRDNVKLFSLKNVAAFV